MSQDEDSSDSDGSGGSGEWAHKREVVVHRPKDPIVQYAVSRYCGEPMGGIQGLWWYAKSLFVDLDGDVADGFLDTRDTKNVSDTDGTDETGEGDGPASKLAVKALVEVSCVSRGTVALRPASRVD